jgi:hypothetical protein
VISLTQKARTTIVIAAAISASVTLQAYRIPAYTLMENFANVTASLNVMR